MNEVKKRIHGVIDQSLIARKNDYLYRISIKCLIKNETGDVLVVKESGRTFWDLPGGGMDHGENIKTAITRELSEEVTLNSDFTYRVIDVEDPAYLGHANLLQVRLVFQVFPALMQFEAGVDADEIKFINSDMLKDSESLVERKVYDYTNISLAQVVDS